MKKVVAILSAFGLILALSACSNKPDAGKNSVILGVKQESGQAENKIKSGNILIAYFTRMDNTNATLDELVQGGGPYGSLGDSFDEADLDAVSSASIAVVDGEAQGNVKTMAKMIQNKTGGELFSIQVAQGYPTGYDELIDQGGMEKEQSLRPELSNHVENMEDYGIVFLGYPNWWYDMTMPVYSFLEEYDFSGKTIIPFASSAGSGFSETISELQEALPDAEVIENGLHIPMSAVPQGQEQVENWLKEIGIQ